MLNVNAAPPAFAEFGLKETIAGTGFDGGGGRLTAEVPDPPPQPAESSQRTREANTRIPPAVVTLPRQRGVFVDAQPDTSLTDSVAINPLRVRRQNQRIDPVS